jgi:membrane protein
LRTLRIFISLRWVRDTWMYLVRIVERMEDNHIFLSAAGISFNALLCFIPLILLVFYVLGFYLDTEAAIKAVDTYLQKLELFPYQREQLRGMVIKLIEEFVGGSQLAGVLGAIGLIWTSSALFAAVRTVLNRIFSIQDTKNILVSKLKDFAMLSIVGMALILVTGLLYGVSLIKGLGQDVFGLELNSWIFNDVVNAVSPFILSFLLFSLVYYMLPDRRMSLRIILTSSSVAAVLWGIAKFVFAYYLEHLWKIGTIYGPYAIVVASAIWVYYSSMTVLFAAEVAEMAEERREMKQLFSEKSLQTIIAQSQISSIEFPTITPPDYSPVKRERD